MKGGNITEWPELDAIARGQRSDSAAEFFRYVRRGVFDVRGWPDSGLNAAWLLVEALIENPGVSLAERRALQRFHEVLRLEGDRRKARIN